MSQACRCRDKVKDGGKWHHIPHKRLMLPLKLRFKHPGAAQDQSQEQHSSVLRTLSNALLLWVGHGRAFRLVWCFQPIRLDGTGIKLLVSAKPMTIAFQYFTVPHPAAATCSCCGCCRCSGKWSAWSCATAFTWRRRAAGTLPVRGDGVRSTACAPRPSPPPRSTTTPGTSPNLLTHSCKSSASPSGIWRFWWHG